MCFMRQRFPVLILAVLLAVLALGLLAVPSCVQQAASPSPTPSASATSPPPSIPTPLPTPVPTPAANSTPPATPTGGPSSCKADFSAQPTVLEGPTWVQFTDQSTGNITSWAWDFGDGTPMSTEQNPRHFYNKNGSHSVTLTVNGPGCEDKLTKESYIEVSKCKT